MTSVYEPREDSELLAIAVRKFSRGRVLDIGTGSGVQAFTALENAKVDSVLALDINPLAVAHVQHRIDDLPKEERQKISVRTSDMFSAITEQDGKFDTIICNPPYLPDEEKDNDPALYGGREGYEWSLRFLTEVVNHIAPNGQILFLFSSLTNRDRIDLELKKIGLHHEEVGMQASFFEQLYVYRIWRVRD